MWLKTDIGLEMANISNVPILKTNLALRISKPATSATFAGTTAAKS